ncbi:hypothetical protein [Streptomyces sp. B21-108]|uniref:hypothetical protein n=1 Tax=Streptomyces sp. B21-108 TaxID=3039419 RepID=UPI002FF2B18B
MRAVIDDQRTWLFEVLRDLSADLGHPDPEHAARVRVLLHDGAFQAAELGDPAVVRETLRRAVDEVFPAQVRPPGEEDRTEQTGRGRTRAPWRTRTNGEQRGTTVKAAEPDKAARPQFTQVSA